MRYLNFKRLLAQLSYGQKVTWPDKGTQRSGTVIGSKRIGSEEWVTIRDAITGGTVTIGAHLLKVAPPQQPPPRQMVTGSYVNLKKIAAMKQPTPKQLEELKSLAAEVGRDLAVPGDFRSAAWQMYLDVKAGKNTNYDGVYTSMRQLLARYSSTDNSSGNLKKIALIEDYGPGMVTPNYAVDTVTEKELVLRSVKTGDSVSISRRGGELFTDTNTPFVIEGQNLSPIVTQALLAFKDGSTPLSIYQQLSMAYKSKEKNPDFQFGGFTLGLFKDYSAKIEQLEQQANSTHSDSSGPKYFQDSFQPGRLMSDDVKVIRDKDNKPRYVIWDNEQGEWLDYKTKVIVQQASVSYVNLKKIAEINALPPADQAASDFMESQPVVEQKQYLEGQPVEQKDVYMQNAPIKAPSAVDKQISMLGQKVDQFMDKYLTEKAQRDIRHNLDFKTHAIQLGQSIQKSISAWLNTKLSPAQKTQLDKIKKSIDAGLHRLSGAADVLTGKNGSFVNFKYIKASPGFGFSLEPSYELRQEHKLKAHYKCPHCEKINYTELPTELLNPGVMNSMSGEMIGGSGTPGKLVPFDCEFCGGSIDPYKDHYEKQWEKLQGFRGKRKETMKKQKADPYGTDSYMEGLKTTNPALYEDRKRRMPPKGSSLNIRIIRAVDKQTIINLLQDLVDGNYQRSQKQYAQRTIELLNQNVIGIEEAGNALADIQGNHVPQLPMEEKAPTVMKGGPVADAQGYSDVVHEVEEGGDATAQEREDNEVLTIASRLGDFMSSNHRGGLTYYAVPAEPGAAALKIKVGSIGEAIVMCKFNMASGELITRLYDNKGDPISSGDILDIEDMTGFMNVAQKYTKMLGKL